MRLPPAAIAASAQIDEPGNRRLLLRTLSIEACDTREGRDGAHVLTVARGTLETLARWESRLTSGSPSAPLAPWMTLVDGTLTLRDGLATQTIHPFDAATFRFR